MNSNYELVPVAVDYEDVSEPPILYKKFIAREKPIKAVQFDGSTQSVDAIRSLDEPGCNCVLDHDVSDPDKAKWTVDIKTVQGKVRAHVGDWVYLNTADDCSLHVLRDDWFKDRYTRLYDIDDSNLKRHAVREMHFAGVEKEIADDILHIVDVFGSQGHSGMSAMITIGILMDVLSFRNITPLTDNPDEWGEAYNENGTAVWQSTRRSDAFSKDGGKTYTLLADWHGVEGVTKETSPIHTSADHTAYEGNTI
jgi:hypothetical protein